MTLTQFARNAWHFLYGCYAWCVLIAVVVPFACLLIPMPGIMRRRRLARVAARLVCRLTGNVVRVDGWRIPDAYACIVIANHASYLDGIILTAALPARFAFLIKREMASVPVTGFVLRRLGSEFVDREDPQDRHRVAKRLVETARRGWTLAVFPEGTFEATPGLQKFRPGAFTAAFRGRLPIVPVVIHGSRRKMPGERKLPLPGPISVHVCQPIAAESVESAEALMQAARTAILSQLDEPDLAACG